LAVQELFKRAEWKVSLPASRLRREIRAIPLTSLCSQFEGGSSVSVVTRVTNRPLGFDFLREQLFIFLPAQEPTQPHVEEVLESPNRG
jgi:hypothetical protein